MLVRTSLVAALLVVLVSVGTAAAEPTPDDQLSEKTALALSIGGTLGSVALMDMAGHVQNDQASLTLGTIGAIGAFVAPSAGGWYAHSDFLTRGLVLRSAGLVAGAYAFELLRESRSSSDASRDTAPLFLLGTAITLLSAGAIDDIARTPGKVHAYNRSHSLNMSVVPMVRPDSTGLAVMGRF
jgi:hypothetical protein